MNNHAIRTAEVSNPEVTFTDGIGPPQVRLRIMATSDLHMHLAAFDYFANQPCDHKGLALTAALIAKARGEVEGALLFDNGDFLQGSPLGDFILQVNHQPNPAILAMNHLQYDAVNIGNHEFSFGMPYLHQALEQAAFPCISANTLRLADTAPARPLLPPTVLLTRTLSDGAGKMHRVRIGVIGVAPPLTTVWDRQAIDGQVEMTDMVATVARYDAALRSEGADLVIVLAHCGVGQPEAKPMAENAALAIASLRGVNALVMGHVHLAFPGPDISQSHNVDPVAGTLAGKPAVMPGVFGSHLGVIDLDLQIEDGRVRVISHHSEARPIAPHDASGHRIPRVSPDPAITALIDPAHRAALDWASRPIGHTPCAIHSYFAMIAHSRALHVVARAQARYVAHRLRGGPYAGIPLLSATAPFKAGGRAGPDNYSFIPPGDLLLRHAADLYLHLNSIVALRLSGGDVRRWLERSVMIFNHLTATSAERMLLNPDIASFNFDLIAGVTYRIDLTAAPGSGKRICDLVYEGRPVRDTDPFILATNSYRSSGSSGFVAPPESDIVLADRMTNRDILISSFATNAHLADLPPETDPLAAHWSFVSCPGSSVLFDSAPESVNFVDEVAHLNLSPVGPTAQGFHRYRLFL